MVEGHTLRILHEKCWEIFEGSCCRAVFLSRKQMSCVSCSLPLKKEKILMTGAGTRNTAPALERLGTAKSISGAQSYHPLTLDTQPWRNWHGKETYL